VLLAGHAPLVVKVMVYALIALALTSINPVFASKNTNPAGFAVNVPVAPPVIIADWSVPVWHIVEGV
jgi:hypothetical protein